MNARLPGYRELLAQLVALPSVSSTNPDIDTSNRPVVELLASWLDDLGFRIHLQELAGGKANLIARLGSGEGGLVLAGHTDTVPWDAGRWNADPFTLTESDGRLYGLGATDMKGFFPTVIEAVQHFDARQLVRPVTIVATADEESSMSGAEALLANGEPRADCAVIGEPTNLIPVRMHKGMMMESIRVSGRSGHSSDPALGLNALDVMQQVLTELVDLRRSLQSQHRHPGFAIPVPTLNLGCIHGGDNPNRICGSCELQLDLRPLPGMALDDLRSQIDARLATVAGRTGAGVARTALFAGIDSYEQPADSALVTAAETFTGMPAQSVAFATEAPFFQKLGMQTVILGPGSIDQAHQPDEYIELEQIPRARKLYAQLIERFCQAA